MAMSTIACASAPGKVILFGEHAVVYGEPAVAAALSDLRIFVKISLNDTKQLDIQMPDLPLHLSFPSSSLCINNKLKEPPTLKDTSIIQAVLLAQFPNLAEVSLSAVTPLVYLLNRLIPEALIKKGVQVSVWSQNLPVGAGLGSSAAFGVACAGALVKLKIHQQQQTTTPVLMGKPALEHLDTINQYAFYSEILLHGTPSGIDNAVSTYGGAIDYTKQPGCERSTMDKFTMTTPLDLMIVNTNVPRSTKLLVARVRSMFEQHPNVVKSILSSMGHIAKSFRSVMTTQLDSDGSSSSHLILTLVQTNQLMLRAVGVSHPSINHICDVVDQVSEGKAAAKLTGAGGGGCAMVVLPKNAVRVGEKIKKALEQKRQSWKFKCLQSKVGMDGVLWIDPSDFPAAEPCSTARTSIGSFTWTNVGASITLALGCIAITSISMRKK